MKGIVWLLLIEDSECRSAEGGCFTLRKQLRVSPALVLHELPSIFELVPFFKKNPPNTTKPKLKKKPQRYSIWTSYEFRGRSALGEVAVYLSYREWLNRTSKLGSRKLSEYTVLNVCWILPLKTNNLNSKHHLYNALRKK